MIQGFDCLDLACMDKTGGFDAWRKREAVGRVVCFQNTRMGRVQRKQPGLLSQARVRARVKTAGKYLGRVNVDSTPRSAVSGLIGYGRNETC